MNDAKSVQSGSHKSDWKYDKPFSGLSASSHTQKAIDLINGLIKKKQWIEEESNDLIKMVGTDMIYL